ncbi:hypothetical protein OPV22_017688 [Ensete ventricosum]|uniref:Secreted protein n=1 Tax=Ensete ventricosum TaxID=4639 RepID=A0AAV8QXT0_ENSVE|nr:hypothetical protein OPV22_017688 [Ensete ventricosum]
MGAVLLSPLPFFSYSSQLSKAALTGCLFARCGNLCFLAISGALCFVNHGLNNDDEPYRPAVLRRRSDVRYQNNDFSCIPKQRTAMMSPQTCNDHCRS